MSCSGDFRIGPAKPQYVDQIYALAQEYSLERTAPAQAAERGFLVSNFQEADYRDFLDRANHFYVLLEQENVCGFVLAYSNDRIQSDEWLNLPIESRHPAPFVFVKQTCVRPDLAGRGLATLLYRYLLSQTQGWPLFAVIVLEPLNHRSIVFHEKHGFKKLFEITPPDGMLRGVWIRNP